MAKRSTRNVLVRDSGSDTAAVEAASEQEARDESREVEKRVQSIDTTEQLEHELEVAVDRLVVLEIMASDVCDTGLFEVNDGWTPDQDEKEKAKLATCESIKHKFVRMAGDSPNVRFLALQVRARSFEISPSLPVLLLPRPVGAHVVAVRTCWLQYSAAYQPPCQGPACACVPTVLHCAGRL